MPCVGLWYVIVACPGQTHLRFVPQMEAIHVVVTSSEATEIEMFFIPYYNVNWQLDKNNTFICMDICQK